MYGLPQAGMLAHRKLAKILTDKDFYCTEHTPGLWIHRTRPIQFSLVVDDFGVKYVGREHVEFLLNTLHRAKYKTTQDWSGSLFCGISIEWDYAARKCWLSMPNYIKMVLARFHHKNPQVKEDAPLKYIPPTYGSKLQMPLPPDTSKLLNKQEITRVQQVVGCLLFTHWPLIQLCLLQSVILRRLNLKVQIIRMLPSQNYSTMQLLTQMLNWNFMQVI